MSGGLSGKAKSIVGRLLGGTPEEAWAKTVWPQAKFADRLADEVTNPMVMDSDLIEALGYMKGECGLGGLMDRSGGLQKVLELNGGTVAGGTGLGWLCFVKTRMDLLEWLFEEGMLGVDDRMPSGKSVLADAMEKSGGYMEWLVRRGASLKNLEGELAGKSIYTVLADLYYWGPVLETLCVLSFEGGLDPWKRQGNGAYPVMDALKLEEGVALWILDRPIPGQMDRGLIGEMMGAAKAANCVRGAERLHALAEAQEVRERMEVARREGLAEFGAMVLSLVEAGCVSVCGEAAVSKEAIERIAKDLAQSQGKECGRPAPVASAPRRI